VLDPFPPRRTIWPDRLASAETSTRADALIRRRAAGIPLEEVSLLFGEPFAGTLEGIELLAARYLPAELPESIRQGALKTVKAFHTGNPGAPGISLETLRRTLPGPPEVSSAVLEAMVGEGTLKLSQGAAALPEFVSRLAGGEELLAKVVGVLEQAGLEPPSLAELEERLGQAGLHPALRHAAQQGRVIQVESDRYFSPNAIERFVAAVRELAAQESITPSGLRERLHLSRKYLIPLLEWADRTGVTRRVGDQRVVL